MKVSKTLMDSWKLKKEHGDIELISAQSGIHRNAIAAAFKNGFATEITLKAIKTYFANKKEQILK